eukprot:scaffold2747_cov104-Cylindrotheca_fusiformis.AAC.15
MELSGETYLEVPRSPILDLCMADDDGGESSAMLVDDDDDDADADGSNDMQAYNELFVYSKGIRIPPIHAEDYKQSLVTVASIVIFNLALAHHLMVDDDPAHVLKNEHCYVKALRLYALALNIQDKGGAFGANVVFILAVLNNSGVIYNSLNRRMRSTEYFGELFSILMLMNGNTAAVGTSTPNMSGFYHNVHTLLLSAGSSAAAPSA